jgi:hypothetical protein
MRYVLLILIVIACARLLCFALMHPFIEMLGEELLLPVVLTWRVVRGQLSLGMAWSFMETWWPLKKVRRLYAKWRIWRASRYRGPNEFHPSLSLDVAAMFELTKSEQSAYLKNLLWRREQAHQASLSTRDT